MSRSLSSIVLTIILPVLAGCVTAPPPAVVAPAPASPQAIPYSSVRQWLNLQQEVSAMSTEEVVEKLVRVNRPEGKGQLFYYGLLNQQLQTHGAWVNARNTFRELQQNEDLSTEQRQLTAVLQEYNQNRINWYQRQSELLVQNADLKKQLHEAEEEKILLEQKIQALTDLEADISTRKEQ